MKEGTKCNLQKKL